MDSIDYVEIDRKLAAAQHENLEAHVEAQKQVEAELAKSKPAKAQSSSDFSITLEALAAKIDHAFAQVAADEPTPPGTPDTPKAPKRPLPTDTLGSSATLSFPAEVSAEWVAEMRKRTKTEIEELEAEIGEQQRKLSKKQNGLEFAKTSAVIFERMEMKEVEAEADGGVSEVEPQGQL